jgi:hypothetical protein
VQGITHDETVFAPLIQAGTMLEAVRAATVRVTTQNPRPFLWPTYYYKVTAGRGEGFIKLNGFSSFENPGWGGEFEVN